MNFIHTYEYIIVPDSSDNDSWKDEVVKKPSSYLLQDFFGLFGLLFVGGLDPDQFFLVLTLDLVVREVGHLETGPGQLERGGELRISGTKNERFFQK